MSDVPCSVDRSNMTISNIWLTADTHFGHTNVIKYCDRPFSSVDEMNDSLIENWNSVVRNRDEVWILGDFAMGKITDTLPLANRLNGRKYLICGNHDRPFQGHGKKAVGWLDTYRDAGFARVVNGHTEIWIGHDLVTMSHFPYVGDSTMNERYSDFRPVDNGRWLLHGHVHGAWRVNGRQINVGVDVNNFTPVNLEDIRKVIGGFEADPPRPQ